MITQQIRLYTPKPLPTPSHYAAGGYKKATNWAASTSHRIGQNSLVHEIPTDEEYAAKVKEFFEEKAPKNIIVGMDCYEQYMEGGPKHRRVYVKLLPIPCCAKRKYGAKHEMQIIELWVPDSDTFTRADPKYITFP